jgi:hypothetical protein
MNKMSYFLVLNQTKMKNLKAKRFELIFIDIFCPTLALKKHKKF